MTTISERIKEAIDQSNQSMSSIARQIGVSPQAVRAWREGISMPTIERLTDLANATNKTVEWFHSGKIADLPAVIEDEIVTVPVLDIRASAGYGANNYELPDQVLRRIDFLADWLRRNVHYSGRGRLEIISATGDSMEPTLFSGDLLLVDRGVNEVIFDAIYVALINGELYVKRFQRSPFKTLVMISDNKLYQPFELKESDDISIVGRVVYRWHGDEL